jgi:hypothetical protein
VEEWAEENATQANDRPGDHSKLGEPHPGKDVHHVHCHQDRKEAQDLNDVV